MTVRPPTYHRSTHLGLLNERVPRGFLPAVFVQQKYPPSATTLHFEFYAEPGPEVKLERKVKSRTPCD